MSLPESAQEATPTPDWDADTGHEFDNQSEPQDAPEKTPEERLNDLSDGARAMAEAVHVLRARYARWPRLDELALHLGLPAKKAELVAKELSGARLYAMRKRDGMRQWMPYEEATRNRAVGSDGGGRMSRDVPGLLTDPAFVKETFGIRLRMYRKRQKVDGHTMKQSELAEVAGISTSTVINLEAGRTDPQLTWLYKFAQEFGIPVHDLVP
jgi:DNA-binding XRE family transcriptional regulator